MQTTLLGLAIAIILALLAALVGPFVVDWNDYRAVFEKEASRLVGLDVRVAGKIDGRLLPSPRLLLDKVEIARPGSEGMRARSLAIEFGLGPLLRGEWRAVEMRLVGPNLHLGLDAGGRVQAPPVVFNFDPDALSIDRLSIEDGTLVLSDAASGASATIEKLWFNGDLRSLLGPVRGEGAFRLGGALYPFRLSASRVGVDGALKLHLNIDPSDMPLALEADGALSFAATGPQFEGTLNLSRPVGIARGGGEALTQPWRVGGKIKATAKSALMELVEFQYGSEQQGVRLTGTADFKFGSHPRFDGVLSSRQIDLDRVLATGDAVRPPPVAVIRQLIATTAGAFRPSFPIRLGVGIDLVTLGGGSIQNLRGDLSTAGGGWRLDRFEFRAPGLAQVQVSGRLAVDAAGVAFEGPADLSVGDPRTLAGWLQGAAMPQASSRPLRARGELMLGSEKIAVERLRAEFDREAVTGRLAYHLAAAGKPARLEAELTAPELDIDAALGYANALTQNTTFEAPRELALKLDLGRAVMAGVEARQASAELIVSAGHLRLDHLSIADLGGAGLSANGQLDLSPLPNGRVVLDLDAGDVTAIAGLVARLSPAVAGRLRQAGASLTPAKLHATLTLDNAASGSRANLAVDGAAGMMRVTFNGQAGGDVAALTPGDIRMQLKLDAGDGGVLARLVGIDDIVAIGKGPGLLMLTASGPTQGTLQVFGRLSAGDLAASANGTLHAAGPAPTGQLYINIANADLAPLLRAGAGTSLPLSLTGRLSLTAQEAALDELSAAVIGARLRGRIAVALASPYAVSGDIDTDGVNAAALLAAVTGLPPAASTSWTWPAEPFGRGVVTGYRGKVSLKAARVVLSPGLDMRGVTTVLRFGDGDIAFEDVSADYAGGRLTGDLALHRGAGGLAARAHVAVTGADATLLTPGAARPAVSGRLGLNAEVEGAGLTPASLVGALRGTGAVTLDDARLAGVNPLAFDAVAQAADRAGTIDAATIRELAGRALDSGYFAVPHASGDFAISAGQLRLGPMPMPGEGADGLLTGRMDLGSDEIDARLILSRPVEAGARPELFVALHGPVTAPVRSIDSSALSGWLTMRAIDRQSKQLQAIESAPTARKNGEVDRDSVTRSIPPLPPPIEIGPAPKPAKVAPRAQQSAPKPRTPSPIPLTPQGTLFGPQN